jgi:gas vesicle protein
MNHLPKAVSETTIEVFAALEEADMKPEPKRQESKPKANTVPETFAELGEEWKQTEGQGIKKKSQNTFEHYAEALSAYFDNFNEKKIVDIQRKDVVTFLNEQAERYSESSLRSMRTVLRKTLNFAVQNQYIVRPHGWLDNRTRRSSRSQGGEDGANCGAEPWHHPQAEKNRLTPSHC